MNPVVNAQRRRQSQWINNEFNEHREDAEAAIADERQRLDQEATSANEKAKKAAEKQKKTGMIAIAGGMAAGVTAGICYSSCPTGGCCGAVPYFAALAAGLGLAGMVMGMASKDNDNIAAQYQGGLLGDPTMGGGGDPTLNTNGGAIIPPGGGLPNPEASFAFDDTPEVTLPNGQKVVPNPENFGPFLKEQGLKWDPKKKSITLPNGKSYTGDDTNNPELRKYASSGEASALQNQLKGLEGQIAKAMGDGSASDALGSGLEDEEGDASLGGGGFGGYAGGNSGGANRGAGALMGGGGRGPGSATDGDASKVAGMSVKMGKKQSRS